MTAIVKDGENLQFGLATFPSSTQTYPAISVDGGTQWRVDGPLFHVDALQGASTVGLGGALRPKSVYFWGQGGNVIWITYDSGIHWWTVAFGAGVERVVSPKRGILEAVAFGNQVDHATALQRFLYATTDSGMTWSLREHLANLRTSH